MLSCKECGNTEFKKESKSDYNVETYCTKCGLILKKDDLADEYDNTGWSERGFRPNSWDICYVNHVTDYFQEVITEKQQFVDYVDDNCDGGIPAGYSRISSEDSNLVNTDNPEWFKGIVETRKPNYVKYLQVNNFEDTDETKIKYIRRYLPSKLDEALKNINNIYLDGEYVEDLKYGFKGDGNKITTKYGNVSLNEHSGYYVFTGGLYKNRGLHVVIWELYYNKVVPKGYIIHHMNGDKLDNRIQNLQCISRSTHSKYHKNKGGD